MAFTSLKSPFLFFPGRSYPTSMTPSFGTAVIDATGEKFAMCGRFWHPSRASKAIRNVGFRFGTVVKASGSGLTVSLQDPSLTTGGPMQPDGTQDQTAAIANGAATFVSNTWHETGNLSADRTVAFGEQLAVVIEYDGSGRLGADSVQISGVACQYGDPNRSNSVALFTASWASQSMYPNVVLKCSDGSYGTLDHAFPCSAINNPAFNSGSSPDEYAMEFTVPVPMKVDGLWCDLSAAADFDLVLYDGTTALASHSFDQQQAGTSSARFAVGTIAEQTLSTGVTYRVAIKPTSATNVTATSFDVNSVLHLDLHDGGQACTYTTRTDLGSWAAPTTTRRMYCGVRVSAVHDGTGGATNQGKRAGRGGGRAA